MSVALRKQFFSSDTNSYHGQEAADPLFMTKSNIIWDVMACSPVEVQ
jgi:hypothetical protein